MSKALAKLTPWLTWWDSFAQGVNFRTSRKEETLPSVVGALFSIVVFAVTIKFAVDRTVTLQDRID